MERCLAAGRRARTRRSSKDHADHSAAFHHEVVVAAGNKPLLRLMGLIASRSRWLARLTSPLDSDAAFDEHVLLAEAIRRGDEEAAHDIATRHILSGRVMSLSVIRDADMGG